MVHIDGRKCSMCGKEAVIFRKHEGRALCRKHFLESLNSIFRKNLRTTGVLPRGSNVALEADSGPGSMFLIFQMKKLAEMRNDIKVICISAYESDEGLEDSNYHIYSDMCSEAGFQHHRICIQDCWGVQANEIACEIESEFKSKDLCSIKRAMKVIALRTKAKETGIWKVFLADTLNDFARETVVEYFGQGIGDEMDDVSDQNYANVVKPLKNIPLEEIKIYLDLKGIKYNDHKCDSAKGSFSARISDMLDELEKSHSGLRFNILKSMERINH